MSTATTNKQVKKIRRCGPYLNCGENKDRTMDKKHNYGPTGVREEDD